MHHVIFLLVGFVCKDESCGLRAWNPVTYILDFVWSVRHKNFEGKGLLCTAVESFENNLCCLDQVCPFT